MPKKSIAEIVKERVSTGNKPNLAGAAARRRKTFSGNSGTTPDTAKGEAPADRLREAARRKRSY